MTDSHCTCAEDPCTCSPPTGEPVVVGEEVVGYQDELFAVDDPPTNNHGSPLL